MNTYIGVDLGTSGMKCLLVSGDGKIIGEASERYAVSYPKNGWSEQDPKAWETALFRCILRLLQGQDKRLVRAISFGGQMHGLVALDGDGNVIRPCILWNDGRTQKQTDYLNQTVGKEKLSARTGNIAFAGFTAPKILWLQENEPSNFEKISKILLPKDYLVYLLTGEFATDFSDASGTLLLDVKGRRWSEEMLQECRLRREQLPQLMESTQTVGKIRAEIAERLGLSANVSVVMGAGDNAAAAIGTGTVQTGDCNVSLGTSGTVFIASDQFAVDGQNALHSFCHANGKWHRMGCILSAASCRAWWIEGVVGGDYAASERALVDCKTDGLYFLPYLTGERSPHNDVNARGCFIGLTPLTTAYQMEKAIMEGVAFAILDCLSVAGADGGMPSETRLCGGGAKSAIWRQIFADVLNMPVRTVETEQGPAFGAAILAMVGAGEYACVEDACQKIVKVSDTVLPNQANRGYYDAKYQTYRQLYPALKESFKRL